jgi:hypothetical protein
MDRSGAFSISAGAVYGRLGTPAAPVRAEFGRVGERCSFDPFLTLFGIKDAALDPIALIVRGADTGKSELTPQSPGLLALSQGRSMTFADDLEQLEHGMVVYDALYASCLQQAAVA